MISDYYVNLHFNQAIAQRTGYAFKIGDKGCTFHFHCEDLDPSGMYPHIVFNHPNNTCVEGVPKGSGRDYAYTIQGNEFAVIGKTVVDLKFYDALDATQRISTASFIIEILPDTYTPFEEASSSYADSLERAREEIDAAIIELQGAEHDLEEAETDLGNMSDQFADTLQDYIDAFGNTAPINPRGAYDPDTPYVPRDAVSYTAAGKTLTYINKQACTGIAPTDPDEGAAHWQIMIDVAVGGALSALEDVSIDPQTLADGQMLTYNNTDDVWENKAILENSLTSTATDKALTAAKGKELQDNKQDKTLETALTIDGTSKTTVETALSGLNAYSDKLKGLLSNENLLDNPWFKVNQRGWTSAIGIYNTYCVDRWKMTYGNVMGTIEASSNGLHIIPNTLGDRTTIYQPCEASVYNLLNGKVLTFSALLSDGTLYKGSNTLDTSTSNYIDFVVNEKIQLRWNGGYKSFWVDVLDEITIRAVKIEIGSISTLLKDTAPNLTTELLKCQRYFVRINVSNGQDFLECTNTDATTAKGILYFPVEMMATPTFTSSGTFEVNQGGTSHAASSLSYGSRTKQKITVIALTTGLTAGYSCELKATSAAYIDLSADL